MKEESREGKEVKKGSEGGKWRKEGRKKTNDGSEGNEGREEGRK